MNWKLIAGLGALGAMVGVVTSLVGMREPMEFATWTMLYLVWTWAAVKLRAPRPILTGVLAGALAGLCTGVVQTLLLDQYRTSNPWHADTLPMTVGDAALGFIVFGVISGAVFGLIFGTLASIWLRRWSDTPG